MSIFKGKSILITGGTGSFGRKFVETILAEHEPKKIIIYSRDEFKQFEMQKTIKDNRNILRFFIGDVRDKDRLYRAMNKVDYVVHAAALKQVPAMEYNPAEAIKTNILGAMNIIDCAIENRVEKVIALSTDKACNPINLYGATKLCSDKLFVAGNHYVGEDDRPRFSVVRYGNVLGSRGSVIPLFYEKKKTGAIPITSLKMTRFLITLEHGVSFVIKNFERMHGGEIFVPKIPSAKITDLAKAIAPECKIEVIGLRPGEKLNEVMISEDDSANTVELEDCYVIRPAFQWWNLKNHSQGKKVSSDFVYSSENNSYWLDEEALSEILGKL